MPCLQKFTYPRDHESATELLLRLCYSRLFLISPPDPSTTKASKIDQLVSEYQQCGYFNGSILVAEHGKVLYERGVGYADIQTHTPNTPKTKFGIASLSKQFTAALVLMQVAIGNLRLDATVSKILPWYRKDTGSRWNYSNCGYTLLGPNFGLAHNQLAQAYLQKQNSEEAIAELWKAIQLSGDCPTCTANLARAYVVAGKRDEALKLLSDLKKGSNPVYSHAREVAMVYAALGDKDQAMRWLEKGYEERFNPGVLLRPGVDPLRSDPQFQDLVLRIGLKP